MIKLIIYLTSSLLSILCFNQINEILLNWNFSWTISKITPYILLVIIGILISFEISNKLKSQKKTIKYFILLLVLPSPFIIGFGLNPIYQGDFSKNGDKLKSSRADENFNENGLSVLTIPGCHFCFESIEKLKIIKKRNPNLSIIFIVCSRDKKSLIAYKKEINNAFHLKLSSNPDKLAELAQMRFPVFLRIRDKKPIYRWSNDQFGVRAIDLLESLKNNL